MPKKRNKMRKKKASRKKTTSITGNKMFLVAVVGMLIIGGGFAAFYMMPGLFSSADTVTFDSATEIIRDRGGVSNIPTGTTETPATEENVTVVDEYIYVNPIQMNLFGIDGENNRIPVPQPSVAAQSAFLGEVEIFDIEFDIYWNFIFDIAEHPERYTTDVEIMIMLSLVDRSVMDTHGNSYTDSYESGMIYPEVFTYNYTVLAAEFLTEGSSYVTLSLVDDLYELFLYADINEIDNSALVDARSVGLMNQVLEDDNVTITELTGMLTYDYGILGYYTVDNCGSEANRALKRLTVTTDPVIPTEVGGMSVYDIGGYSVSDSALLVVGLGVFCMIAMYYHLSRRR